MRERVYNRLATNGPFLYESEDRTEWFFTFVHQTEWNQVAEDPYLPKQSPEHILYFYISLNLILNTSFS